MRKTIPINWGLSEEQVVQIFEVEKQQAEILRKASSTERKSLYGPVYEAYFQQLPFHPQFTIKSNEAEKKERVDFQLARVKPFLKEESSFMEIGAGDCSLSIAASKYCKKVYTLEVSEEIVAGLAFPENVSPVIFDGFNIPIEDNMIDLAYSNQLMEHLHPDDAIDQGKSIYRVLKPKGRYICITPNKHFGPCDISRFFTDELVGFHLKEYSGSNLKDIFEKIGFYKVEFYTIIKGRKINIPFLIVKLFEKFITLFNHQTKDKLAKRRIVSSVLNATVVAIK